MNQFIERRRGMKKTKGFRYGFVLTCVIVSLSFPSCGFSSRLSRGDLFVKIDIPYTSQAKAESQFLDVYAPPQAKRAPVLFFVHGGGWRRGSKDQTVYQNFVQAIAHHGFVTVVPNYRLSSVAEHPAQIEDVASAFAWTYRNISKYGGDPNLIFVSGHSAGGHLVSLLALDRRYLQQQHVPAEAIKGVLALSAVFDITKMRGRSTKTMAEPAFGDNPSVWKEASPMDHVRSGLPPFLVLYAKRDPDTLKEQAVRFAAALREKKDRVVLVELKRQGHLSEMLRSRRGRNPMIPHMLDFLDELIPQKDLQHNP